LHVDILCPDRISGRDVELFSNNNEFVSDANWNNPGLTTGSMHARHGMGAAEAVLKEHQMFNSSTGLLRLLASLVWYSGAVVLAFKSSKLLIEAHSIHPGPLWIWLAVLSGLLIGFIKAKYLFTRLCIKNLKRIDSLKQPKLWQFYRIPFFFFLLAMIILGSFISQLAHGNYSMLITMAIIEVSLATALLGSSHCFWQQH